MIYTFLHFFESEGGCAIAASLCHPFSFLLSALYINLSRPPRVMAALFSPIISPPFRSRCAAFAIIGSVWTHLVVLEHIELS